MRSSLTLFGTLSLSVAIAQQWELVTPIKTRSEFTALKMVNDAVGYAVDNPMGAILRTHDGGAHWERMVNNLGNNPIAMHVWDEERAIVVGENGSVYRTTDGFTNTTGSNDPTYGHFNCVFFLNDTLGWAGTEGGRIYRSTDGGASWALMNSGQGSSNYITAIQFLDTDLGYATCAGGGLVLKSTDGGLTWQDIGPEWLVLIRDFHFFDALTGVGVGSAGDVIRTTDGGATWDSIPSNTTYTMEDLDVQGDVMVACGWWGHTIRSTDTGLTWTEILAGNIEHRSVSLLPSGAGLLGTDGRILSTDDMGLSWGLLVEGTWHTRINKMSFMDADSGVAVGWQTTGGFEGGLLRTTDGGMHWSKAGGGGLGVHLTPEGYGCKGGSSGAFARTTDGFDTQTSGSGPDVAIRCTWSFDATTHIVAGGAVYGGIYRTSNGGQDWVHVLDVGNITISDLWFVDDLQGYAVGEYGDNYGTSDGGLSWEPLPPMGGSHTIFFLNEQLGWTGNNRTVDGGDTWTNMGGTPQNTLSIFFTDPDTGYAVGYTGQTVRSTDGGITWENFLPEILNATVGDAAWVDGAIVIGCNNGDIFRAQVNCPNVTGIPVITQAGELLCTNTSGAAQWYLNDGPLPDGNTPCITATEPGDYYVIVTDVLGCVSAPSATVQVINTGIAPAPANSARLVPNPATDMVRIERSDATPALVTFTDMQGRTVHTERLASTGAVIHLPDVKCSVYFVRITTADHVETLRLVKE